MAPGDLNLKKSWHPGLMKNQQKVWEAEQEALQERKKIQERQLEIAKEKELAELQALQYAKTGKKASERMGWMYDKSGVGDGGKLITSETEDYLLGKKRVDSLIINSENVEEKKKHGFEKIDASFNTSQKDELMKSREDPMQKIKAQQMKKMAELREQKKLEEEKNRSERGHRSSGHSHRRSRHDDDRSDRHRDERHREERHRSERHRSERHSRQRDSSREHRDRDRDYYRDRDEKYRYRDAGRREDRSSRSYKPASSEKNDTNLNDREARLREMLVNSQQMKNTRDDRIQRENIDQLKREEELRSKLLASKAGSKANAPDFLQASKRIID